VIHVYSSIFAGILQSWWILFDVVAMEITSWPVALKLKDFYSFLHPLLKSESMILRFLKFIPNLLNLDQSESMGFEGNQESKVLTSKKP